MSEEKIDAIKRLWEALNGSERKPPTGLVTPDARLEPPSERMTTGPPVYYGPAEWLDYALALDEMLGEVTFEPEEFFEAPGGRILVYVTAKGYGRGSGAPFEQKVAHLYEVRDGQIASLKVFMDRVEALEAAGLSG